MRSRNVSGDVETVNSRDGTLIAIERVGHGPAIVCVDGALSTRRLGPGQSLALLLSGRYTVYTYDRRGRGDSGDTRPYDPEREIEDLDAVITYAGGDASVFGHSSGAVLALEAAAHGVAIKRLALYETPFVVDDTRRPAGDDWPRHLESLITSGRRGGAIKRFMTEIAGAPAFIPFVMSLTPMWSRLKTIAHTLAYDSAIMANYQKGRPLPGNRWSSVNVPTLLLLGSKSPAWITNAVQALHDTLPRAELTVLDGQTHMVKPKVTAPALLEFFGAGAPTASLREGALKVVA
jgi:pimeloyl-ACP methyl ester carboxylesterase